MTHNIVSETEAGTIGLKATLRYVSFDTQEERAKFARRIAADRRLLTYDLEATTIEARAVARLLREDGRGPTEIAHLLGITRVTAAAWTKGIGKS